MAPRGSFASRPQRTAVCFDDRTADRQSQAQAVRLGRVESVEEILQGCRRKSRTRIPHGDERIADSAVPVVISKFPMPFAHRAHRLDGVEGQVKDHLLQFDPISSDGRQALEEVCLHQNPFFMASPRVSSITSRIAALISTRSSRGVAFLTEITNPVHDSARPIAVPDNAVERLPELVEIGGSARSHRSAAWALATVAAIGWFTSWAIEAVS